MITHYEMVRYLRQVYQPVIKREYPRNYFRVNVIIMRFAVLWLPESKKNIFSLSYLIFCVITGGIFVPIIEFMYFPNSFGDLSMFIYNLGGTLTHLVSTIKAFNWCFQHKRILALMEVLQSKELHYDSHGDFEPGLIAQKAKQKNIIFSTMFFWSCNMVFVAVYGGQMYTLIFQPDALDTVNLRGEKEYCWKLPFLSWMPFDHSTYWTCVLAYTLQFVIVMYITRMIVAVDTLFVGIINYITAHLEILQGAFKTIRPRAIAILGRGSENEEILHDDDELNVEMKEQMKKATKHMQTVYSLCNTMEEIYSMQTLIQVLDTLVVMCTCMYTLSMEPIGSELFILEMFYLIAIQFQLSLYCWFGNEMTLAHSKIPSALYECDWFSTNRSFKTSMLITMLRARRDLVLTVGNFTPLTLNTLVAIIRGSYSLFAVLKKSN